MWLMRHVTGGVYNCCEANALVFMLTVFALHLQGRTSEETRRERYCMSALLKIYRKWSLSPCLRPTFM